MFISIQTLMGMSCVTDLGICDWYSQYNPDWQEREWYAEAYCFLYKDCCCMPYSYGTLAVYQMPSNGTADNWLNEANRLYLAGYYEEAATSYANAVRNDPSLSVAWLNMGNALYFQNRYKESLDAYDAVLKLEPHHINALEGKNQSLLALNRINESSAIL
ncbi:MAG: tetratricopeptide repeat protein [Methanotrichaceae archaeon]|nr:tetratricopeptide repeat protein [Methanotrichaceae archaeon]